MQYGLEWEESRLLELRYGVGYGGGRKQEVGCHPALLRVLIHLGSVNNLTPFSPSPHTDPILNGESLSSVVVEGRGPLI